MDSSGPEDELVTRDERGGGGGRETNRERGKGSPADFVFQIKALATSGDKDVSDRMRK